MKKEKGFKLYLAIFASLMLLAACGGSKEKGEVFEVDEELLFTNHKLTVEQVEVYEKDGKSLMDVKINWTNLKLPDKSTFFLANGLDVKQGGTLLTEANDAWSDKKSDVYFPNASGGKWTVDLTYELVGQETPIDLVFIPMNDHDETQTITVDIQ